ncbi:hypothetical protein CVU75_00470 [Candidatus Dependentiae bacterium HGW-Dependentiae-1]|nr:MAG: hypothetical protein CVU75_00470 [Candidatus Dependentiae bacterium HGW-Dependentiae-1]
MFFLHSFFDTVLGLSLIKITLAHMLARAFLAYAFGIMLTMLNRHFIVERSSFDIIVKLIIGTSLSGAMLGLSPYFETMAMLAFLVFLNWLLSLLSFQFTCVDIVLSGKKQVLFENNKINFTTMRRNFITERDLLRALREKGIKTLEQAEFVYIENDGDISVIKK